MKYEVRFTTQFKKDLKLAKKQGKDTEKLFAVIEKLANGEALEENYSDLYMKCRYLDELTGGKEVVFATGTPISNSMVELYTMQKYLQYNLLKRNNLIHFDC